ncbi:LamG domain-containing protein [Actinoplanes subtropicus]|uniref:LamG domain-containing protein n=1 Tax=Actinoplanes subtropicus TaxID=543632 RepID=UPI0004C457F7|nr:LamG domain-containing protein [Actinoplanes subtropicus]
MLKKIGAGRWHVAAGALAVACVLAVLARYADLPRSFAAFSATGTSSGNSVTAGPAFPDYPTRVTADHPSVYYRLNDSPGSTTALDSSGNGRTGVFDTTDPDSWTGFWPFDEGSGGTARDLSAYATPHDLTISGAGWTASGRSGNALSFNGTSDYAATATNAVTTNAPFTVAAWVYLTDNSVSRTAVSQQGVNASAFELGYDKALGRWAFELPHSDNAAAPVDVAKSTGAPVLNRWTLLVGSFSGNHIDLWVDGAKQGGGAGHGGAHVWASGGAFEVGDGLSTSRTDFWAGRVDSVRIWDAYATTADAQEWTLGPTGGASTDWQFDEGGAATSTVDNSGNLNTGTLGPAAGWGAGQSGAKSVSLTGSTNSYVAGAAPGVDTSASFTVSAWVFLSGTTLGAMSRVALSQSGTNKSGFLLRYDYSGTRWEFAVTQGAADDNNPVFDSSVSAIGSAALNNWTHLIGVYDRVAQTVTLYVDGVAMAPAAHTSVFAATGPLQVGRVKEFGGWMTGAHPTEAWGPWSGRIDDVQMFRRALDAPEVSALYNGGGTQTTLGVPGALQGAQQGQQASTAMAFGADGRALYTADTFTGPTTYSTECWFRSAGLNGGTHGVSLVSFGSSGAGNSSGSYDRRLFLDTAGHLVAGTASGTAGTAQSPGTYFDGGWHYAAVTVSPGTGLTLYVDGRPVATAAYTAPANLTGYWRWGGDTWGGAWPADYLRYGELDEAAIYPAALSAQQVSWHYHANH